MPRIVAAATAFPPHAVPQEQVREAIRLFFAGSVPALERLLPLFDHCRIDRRHFMMPLEWYLRPRSLSERNTIYLQHGLALLASAARRCLERAGLPPARIDQVITVTSTGYATPTLDAGLVNTLAMRPGVSRLPVWGLGCAAGAAGLARAADYCRAFPHGVVLLTALECCSLTFMAGDLSKKNLVATALFSDGAAAVLVAGEQTGLAGPRLRASRSHLFPDSDRIMGWDFLENGMQLVLSPRLPLLVREKLPVLVNDFLDGLGLQRKQIAQHLAHPGGARVIDAYLAALHLPPEELALTEDALREHGNTSSVAILTVLENWLPRAQPGLALLTAFGPGFSAEMSLLER